MAIVNRARVYEHIDAHLNEHVERIRELVRQPSVSLERDGLHACAELVAQHLVAAGCAEASVVDVGDGYPGVWGRIDSGMPATLLCYGHYDVRPVGEEEWSHPPFAADIAPFHGFPRTIIGRGAAASKGPLQAWINAIGSILEVEGQLPVNLVFLVEGAEILGSPNYPRLVESHLDGVKSATALYGPRASQDRTGTISITLGYKGLVYLELTASSESWGRGPHGGPVHSATNAIVDNPAWRLIQALSTVTDESGAHCSIPALLNACESGKTIELWERPLLDQIRRKAMETDPNGFIPGLSPLHPVEVFKQDLSAPDLLQQYMYGPSVNISGLRGGYTGPGTKSFLLPDSATATLDIRMITHVRADDIVKFLREHLDSHGFSDIRISVKSAYDWDQTPVGADLVRAALATLEKYGYSRLIWPMQAYGGPWAHFAKAFGIPALQGAAPGLGERAATSDEFFVIDGDGPITGLAGLERYYVDFLYAYAGVMNQSPEV